LPNVANGEPIKLKAHTAVSYKTHIIMFGGEKAISENSNTVYLFDTIAQNWKKPKINGENLIPKVDSHCAVVLG